MAKQQQINKLKKLIESSLSKLERLDVCIEDYIWDLKIKFANNNNNDEKKQEVVDKNQYRKISLLADIKQNNMCNRGHTMVEYYDEKCNKCNKNSKYLCFSCKHYEKQYCPDIYDKNDADKYCWCDLCSLVNANNVKKEIDRNIQIQAEIIKFNNNNPEISVDLLCGLPNKIALEYLLKEVAVIDQERDIYCLYVFDIDNFKKLNKDYGHHGADQKLQQISKTLKIYTAKSETFWKNKKIEISRIWPFRQGGDEFAMVVKGRDKQISTQNSFYEMLKKDINNIGINVSVGMYCYGSDGKKETFDIWLNKADLALYQVKKEGKNGIYINIGAYNTGLIGGFDKMNEHSLFDDEFDF